MRATLALREGQTSSRPSLEFNIDVHAYMKFDAGMFDGAKGDDEK